MSAPPFGPPFGGLLPAETDGPEATQALGRKLAAHLPRAGVVALYGALGAGKTHLAKGLAEGLGIAPEAVHSPTFTIVNEHAGRYGPVYHFDAYRIEHLDEFFELGFEEYFYADALSIVEWPARVEPLLPPDAIRLRLTALGPTRRRVERVEATAP